MTKTVHTVDLPCGATAKRTSASRVYPFVLVARDSYAYELRRDDKAHDHERKNFAYHTEIAGREAGVSYTIHVPGKLSAWSYEKTYTAQEIADAAARVAGHADAEAYAQALRAERVARIEAKKAAGGYDTFHALTWSSRRDLADKARTQFPGFEDFRILETVRS